MAAPRTGQRDRSERGERGAFGDREGFRRKRKRRCSWCVDKASSIDYKNVSRLRRELTERGKIKPRRQTAACSKHQRLLAMAIKRARHMGLLPYTLDADESERPRGGRRRGRFA